MDINQLIIDRQMSLPQAVGMDRKGIPTDQKESEFSVQLDRAENSATPVNGVKKDQTAPASASEKPSSQKGLKPMPDRSQEEPSSDLEQRVLDDRAPSSEGTAMETPSLDLMIGLTQEELEDCGEELKKLAPAIEGVPQTLLPTTMIVDAESETPNLMQMPGRSESLPSPQVSSIQVAQTNPVAQLESWNQNELPGAEISMVKMVGEELSTPSSLSEQIVLLDPKKVDPKVSNAQEFRPIPKRSDDSNLKTSLEDLFLTKKMGLELSDNVKPVVQDESNSTNSFAPKKEKLEDFVSGLFVQSNIKSEAQIPLFENKLHKLMTSVQSPTSSQNQVGQNLFKDLNLELTRMVQRQSGGELTLQLRPGDMGHVKVDVAVTGDSIRIEMMAEKSASESLIKSQLGELKTQLTQAGFKIDELAVMAQKSSNTQSGFDGSNSGREHQQQSQQQNRRRDPEASFSSDFKFDEKMLGAA